jgi:hypothetical protein
LTIRLARCWAALLLGVGLLCLSTGAAAQPPLEYQLQAAYVSKFLRFVEWPAGTVEGGVFAVGVVGKADFWEAMRALDGQQFGDSRVAARRIDDPEQLSEVHVLVVDPTRSSQLAGRYLRAAQGRPILTVGRADDFASSGGIIQFVLVEETLRFDINTEAADRAGLKISSHLLRSARNFRERTP